MKLGPVEFEFDLVTFIIICIVVTISTSLIIGVANESARHTYVVECAEH